MTDEALEGAVYQCRRCGDDVDNADQWFRHSWSEEPAKEDVQKAIDEGKTFDDWFADGAIMCPSCHADYLVFLGVEA